MNNLEKLLVACQKPGLDSDPEHEAGDLQEILRSCWKRLTPHQQNEVFNEHRDKLEWLQ